MKLIDDWKNSGKLWSVKAAIAIVVINMLIALLGVFEMHIPPATAATLNVLLGTTTALLRLVLQPIAK
jgi:hypothetical protein